MWPQGFKRIGYALQEVRGKAINILSTNYIFTKYGTSDMMSFTSYIILFYSCNNNYHTLIKEIKFMELIRYLISNYF